MYRRARPVLRAIIGNSPGANGALDSFARVASTGDVEKRQIEGQPVRIVASEGTFAVLAMVNGDLVMTISAEKSDGIKVITSIIKAN